MTDHLDDVLSAYLDDELSPAERATATAHLAHCATCQATLDDLRAITKAAAEARERGLTPSPTLWPGIATAMATEAARTTTPRPRQATPWYRRRLSMGIGELAAAAALVAAFGTVAWRSVRPDALPAAGPIAIVAESESVGGAGVRTVSLSDPQLDAAIADLERVLLTRRHQLDPRTVLVIERNLRAIDDAVREATAALATDPGNAMLTTHVVDRRRRKLALLRRAAQMTEGD